MKSFWIGKDGIETGCYNLLDDNSFYNLMTWWKILAECKSDKFEELTGLVLKPGQKAKFKLVRVKK